MSARELADKIQADGHRMSRGTIAHVESLRTTTVPRAITVDQLMWLAKAFSVRPDSLLTVPKCTVCSGSPPEGFSCNTCHTEGT